MIAHFPARFGLRLALLACCFLLRHAGLPAADNESDDSRWHTSDALRREVAERLEQATVWVVHADPEKESIGFGTGFVVADGFILTNAHVVPEDGGGVILAVNEFMPPVQVRIVAMTDPDALDNDFALLSYTPPDDVDLPILPFNLDVQRMDRVSSWGFPGVVTRYDKNFQEFLFGDGHEPPPLVFNEGSVSAIVKTPYKHIFHSATIAKGNSGGPLVNSRGEVVGVNTWVASEMGEGKGASANASLHAEDAVKFLRENGVTPLMARKAGMPKAAEPDPDSDGEDADDAEELLARAEEGDADAQYQVGANFFYGDNGFPEDNDQAAEWFRQAAQQDHGDAMAMLGITQIAWLDEPDPEEGLEWMYKAAENEDTDPANVALLGKFLLFRDFLGVERNSADSYRFAKQAADDGAADGLALMALHYYFGFEVEKNLGRALRHVRLALAADEENSLAKAVFAHMLFDGDYVQQDYARARRLAEEAAEDGEGMAESLMAFLYMVGGGVDQDYEKAAAWAERAAERGDYYGREILGKLYLEGWGVERNLPLAWAYITLANEGKGVAGSSMHDRAEGEMSVRELREAEKILAGWREEWAGLSR